MKSFQYLLITFLFFQAPNYSQNKNKNKSHLFLEHTQSFKGFFDFNYHHEKDIIYLTVKELDKEFLYVNSLSEGIGNNDIGLDRGQLGKQRVVYFTKSGNRLLLVEPNQKFRANSDNFIEKQSVDQAFAKSVIWSFKIESIIDKNYYLIDLNKFLLNDTHEVANKLNKSNQGSYFIDKDRSSINLYRTKSFPKNTEFDIQLTYSGQAEGDLIRSVTPSPNSLTVHQHHSFIELPPLNFKMRQFDPRSGVNAYRYYDYATPVTEPTLKEYVVRHRLEKKNPELEISEAINPIIYYLDNNLIRVLINYDYKRNTSKT